MKDLPPLWNRNFSLMTLSATLTFMSFYFLLPTLPMFLHLHFRAENREIGAIIGAFTLASLITRPFFGYFLDRGHKRLIYLSSIFLFGLFAVPYAFVPSLAALLALRFAHGVTWGATTIASSSIVVDFIPPARRGEGLGIYGVGITFAMAFGPLIATSIFSGMGYHALFFIATALGLASCMAAGAVKFPLQCATNPLAPKRFSIDSMIERKVLSISTNMMLMSFSYGGLLSFVPIYGQEINVKNPGMFFLVFAAGLGIARLLAGKSFDRRGPKVVGTLAFVAMIMGFVSLSLTKSIPGFFCAAFVLGISQGMLTPTFQAMVNELIHRERRGAANSTYFTAFDLGIASGTVVVGLLADKIGLSGAFAVCAGCCLLGLAFFTLHTLPHFLRTRLHA
jgi:MFS family permease